jgi:hypothetical protein
MPTAHIAPRKPPMITPAFPMFVGAGLEPEPEPATICPLELTEDVKDIIFGSVWNVV